MRRHINLFANLILITILIFLVVSLIYAVRRSEFYASGTMTKFYLVFGVGIILCSFALRLRQDHKINFTLSILSLAVGVYLFEIYLSFYNPDLTNIYAQAAKERGIPFDERTRYQAFLDLVAEKGEAYPSTNIINFIEYGIEYEGEPVFPLGGISEKITLLCNESGEYVSYQADEHGFNNPTGLYGNDETNLVLVGDSYTQGYCVPAGEDLASQLRKKLGKQIISFGYAGNGPLIELAALKEYAEPLKPKMVFWIYYEGNDLEDLAIEQHSPALLNYLDRNFSQNLFSRQVEVDKALITYMNKEIAQYKERDIEETRLSLNTQFARVIRLYHLRGILQKILSVPPPPPPPPPLFEEIFREARDRTAAWGGELHFVYLPAWQRYSTEVDQGSLFHRDQVLSTIASLDIPIIDMHQVISQHPDPLSLFPFRLSGHYVTEGYALVATTIETYLEETRDTSISTK